MLNGYKTYAGILIVIIGWLGFGELVTEHDLGLVIDNVVQLAGIVLAIYGRYKAKV